jgi:flavodoxin
LSRWKGILQYNLEKEGSAMKSLVVYSSQTGNTRKLAQAAYDSLAGQKEIHKVEDAPAPDGFERSALCGSCC